MCCLMSQARSWRQSWTLIPACPWRQGQLLSQVTPAPPIPGHSLLLPSQLTAEAQWSQWWMCAGKIPPSKAGKKKGGKLLPFSRHFLAFPSTDGCLGSAGNATAEPSAIPVARILHPHLLGGDTLLSHAPRWDRVVASCQMALVRGTGVAAGRGSADTSPVHPAEQAQAARDEVSGSEVVWVPPTPSLLAWRLVAGQLGSPGNLNWELAPFCACGSTTPLSLELRRSGATAGQSWPCLVPAELSGWGKAPGRLEEVGRVALSSAVACSGALFGAQLVGGSSRHAEAATASPRRSLPAWPRVASC